MGHAEKRWSELADHGRELIVEEINIKLSPNDIRILDRALSALPYREVVALIKDINRQISEQIEAQKEAKNAQKN